MSQIICIIDDNPSKTGELKKILGAIGFQKEKIVNLNSSNINTILNNPETLKETIPTQLLKTDMFPVFIIDINLSNNGDEGYLVAEMLTEIFSNKAVYILNSVKASKDSGKKLPKGYLFYLYDQDDEPKELLSNIISGENISEKNMVEGTKTSTFEKACKVRHRIMNKAMGNSSNSNSIDAEFKNILVENEFSEIKDKIEKLKKEVHNINLYEQDYLDIIRKKFINWIYT